MQSRPSVDEPVHVVPYQDAWPREAREEGEHLRGVLGDLAQDLEHIGSTAVPGLAAKPVLDIAVAVQPGQQEQAVRALSAHGFEDLGEAGVPGRRYLRRRGGGTAVNVHLMAPGSPLWTDNLLLRDYLRADPRARATYAAAKQGAAARHQMLLAYSAAKAEAIRDLLSAARTRAASSPPPGFPAAEQAVEFPWRLPHRPTALTAPS